MKYIVAVFLILCIAISANAQSYREGKCGRKGVSICPNYTIFEEVNSNLKKGQGYSFTSINIDKNLLCRSKNLVSLRLGLIYASWRKVSSVGVPIELCLMFGKSATLLEVALGYQFQYFYENVDSSFHQTKDHPMYHAATGRIGIRYERPKGGIFFRFGFTPLYGLADYTQTIPYIGTSRFIPMFGGAVGLTFRKWPKSKEE